MTDEWLVGECDRLPNEIADNCHGMKLRILKKAMFAIDGFKIVTEKSITISETDLTVTEEAPIH